jgi:hypothetical protein
MLTRRRGAEADKEEGGLEADKKEEGPKPMPTRRE